MAAGTLYTYPDNFRAAKALIAAQYAKANVKLSPNFVFGETNKSPAFLKKFPNGKVPAFESNDGKFLQDSNAIAYYVSNDQLRGKSDYDRAQILQWIGFAEGEILPAGCAWVFPILGIISNNAGAQEAFQRAKDDMKSSLTILNSHLLTRTYLVGERISLADIVVACNLLNPYKYVLDPEYRTPFVNVNRWFLTLINQPEFKAVFGEVELCSKPAQAGAAAAEGKGKKKEEKKQEKKQKPKKETPQEQNEPEELDAAEAALAEEPQSKDPFDSMPKGETSLNSSTMDQANERGPPAFVFFDLETSGLDEANAEVLQIGMCFKEQSFGIFVKPTKPIAKSATAINGLTFHNGELHREDQTVSSLSAVEALHLVNTFLQSIKKPIVLVAHNAKFDSPRFIRMLQKYQLLQEFKVILLGFADTLPVFRTVRGEYVGNSLVQLAEAANINYEGAHDAIADACILQKLIIHYNISNDQLMEKFVTVDECQRDIDKRIQIKKIKATLERVLQGVLSKIMIQKIASAGITSKILVDTFKQRGEAGLYLLLSEDVNGKPRITKQKRIIGKVVECVQHFCSQD